MGVVNDIGMKFDSKLYFNNHVDGIRNKSYKTLGLIKRTFNNLHNKFSLNILYFSL